MSTHKEYDIRTIDDLIKMIESSNLENLMIDMKLWLLTIIAAKELARADGLELADLVHDANFRWIDDGEHNITTTVIKSGQ